MKKCVFLVIPNLGIGGAERLVIDLATHLNKERYRVFIVCLYDKRSTEYPVDELPEVEVVRMGKKKGFDIMLIYHLVILFRKQKPDVVHTHLSSALYVAIPSIIARTKTRLHTIHNVARAELAMMKRFAMFILYHLLGFKPVAISDYIRDDVSSYYLLPKDRVKLVYNGIDIHKFSSFKKESRTNSGQVRIISIGRLVDNKNHSLLIDAFALAVKNYPEANIKLEIAGDGLKRNDLERQIDDLGISRHARLLGIRSDTPHLLSRSDIYVNTSLVEGLPLTILEAMSSGLPVIATPAGGTVDIVKDGFNGIITEWDSHEVMTAIIGLVNDAEARKKMGARSTVIVKDFDIKIMTEGYEKIYS